MPNINTFIIIYGIDIWLKILVTRVGKYGWMDAERKWFLRSLARMVDEKHICLRIIWIQFKIEIYLNYKEIIFWHMIGIGKWHLAAHTNALEV